MLTPIIKTKAISREAGADTAKAARKTPPKARGKKKAARGGRDLLADAVNGIQLVKTGFALDL